MYRNINDKKNKKIKQISLEKEEDTLLILRLGNEIYNINADNCELLISKNYDLHDLEEKIFIEFGECEKPKNVNFDNDNLENVSYHYFYIEYKDPNLKKHYYYCFCLACKMNLFEGLYMTNYTD